MSDSISHDSQFITGTGSSGNASGAGDGDDGWQQQRPRRQQKGGSPSESDCSRATKSTEIVVPAGQAKGAVAWVCNKWDSSRGGATTAHLKGWTDSRKVYSKIT
jgi:hypothetical protein